MKRNLSALFLCLLMIASSLAGCMGTDDSADNSGITELQNEITMQDEKIAELEAEVDMRAKFPPIADAIEEEFGALRIGTERKPYLMRPLGSERDSRPYVKGSAPGVSDDPPGLDY